MADRTEQEGDIEQVFGKHININSARRFVRITWEDIYNYIANSNLSNKDKDMMIWYFKNKTIGYKRYRAGYEGKYEIRKLQRAFLLERV